jgi:hypothetical protein
VSDTLSPADLFVRLGKTQDQRPLRFETTSWFPA